MNDGAQGTQLVNYPIAKRNPVGLLLNFGERKKVEVERKAEVLNA